MKKQRCFVSIIWGYPRYFHNFAKEEHYHQHALSVAKEMGYQPVVIIQNEPGIIENDPLFIPGTKVIYYKNILQYLFHIISYSFRGAVFYVNSVTIPSLVVPLFARHAVFMGHTHPERQSKLKQWLFDTSMHLFARVRLNNNEEKDFLLERHVPAFKLFIVPLSLSFEKYKVLDENANRKDLVYFGNITAKKNLTTIIRACNLVAERYPGTTLHLVGREYDPIEDSSISPKLSVVRHGFIEKAEDVNKLLNQYVIYLNSSFDEGMCVAVYNAALAGCALCLPNIMSFKGVFKDKALFHDVTDHEKLAENIIWYLEHPTGAHEHNAACRTMIHKDFSYRTVSADMKKLFTF